MKDELFNSLGTKKLNFLKFKNENKFLIRFRDQNNIYIYIYIYKNYGHVRES